MTKGRDFAAMLETLEFGVEEIPAAERTGEPLRLPIDQVVEDPNQPRRNFDEDQLDELAASIRERGVLQPIIVRPRNEAGLYVIRFGERRYRASKRAGKTDIPVYVSGAGASEADTLMEQVIENDQREPLTTAELAASVSRLLKLGRTQKQISQGLGRPPDQISRLASLEGLPAPLEPLAAVLGLDALWALHQAWKADAAAVSGFLEGREPETITRAEARALLAQVTAPKPPRTPPAPPAPETRPEPAARTSEAETTDDREDADETPPARPRAKTKGTDNDAEGGVVPAQLTPEPRSQRTETAPVIMVEVDGRRGRLVADQEVLIAFEESEKVERRPLQGVRLLGG